MRHGESTDPFYRFMDGVWPRAQADGIPSPLLGRQQYTQRACLVWIIQHAMGDYAITSPQKLRVARDLSHPEAETQPQRWAALFLEKAHELRALPKLARFYLLAADACELVTKVPDGDSATATDGNGDVQFDEVA